ncbi:probable helicase CHR10 isoform X1 [Solanum verrucosum]|uniref:probable helicase CHR10 isoform X1 n=1 Tax=Solanum verrucosum TaxID=315347 RepID=UPI0020D027C9|nr:probable helicase CHR10 isoform X1 [Solanum verrucosum]
MMRSQNSKDFIEMGLGKTLQAISLLSYLKVYLKTPGPFLVLCPLSVTDGWMSEMANFAPKLRVLSYTGEKEHRRNLRRKIYECMNREVSDAKSIPFDVLLTTYDIVLLDEDFLSQVPWCYAIIDEAQRLKNPSSVLYNVLKERFVMPRKLLMTGTPIQNNLSELWALFHFCMPSVFGTLEQFLSAFKEAGDPSCPDADKAKEQFKILKYVIGAFMLRRTKSQLIELGTLVLPPLTEITVMAPLVALQKKVYMSILRKELTQLLALASGAPNTRSLQNIVIQLRKACSHPYLFAGIEPEPYEEGEHLVQASGKLLILDHLLQKLHACGHRVLLFSQMTQTLDILQDYLELRKYSYERLDGSIRAEERFAAIRSFSHNRSKFEAEQNAAFVFLISTRAGGVGLNLVAADTVIFYEQDWNPQVDKQALQRAHRIGQTNHVLSINLVTEQSVEEVIMRRAQRKLQLSHNIVGDDVLDQEGKEMAGAEAGDLRSVMLGLHMLDPAEVTNEESDKFDRNELTAMAETIMAFRNEERSARDDKFEVKPANFLNEFNVVTKRGPESIRLDHILDETSYLEWVEKFKEASQINHNPIFELGNRRSLPEEKHLKAEAAKKKAEEEKLSKWETLGYHSLSVKDPVSAPDTDISSDSGAVHFVYGDCTRPSKVSPSEPTIIFSCVDTSGNWGHGGMFDALARLSTSVPAAYERASEFVDLHLGDLHLIEITEDLAKGGDSPHAPQWVALAVVQSYNPRRKVPRGSVSIPDLERCLSKASYSAAQKSASIHMPRIGYQDGSDRSEWYTIERLLRKYAALHGINIFVYYFRRASQS